LAVSAACPLNTKTGAIHARTRTSKARSEAAKPPRFGVKFDGSASKTMTLPTDGMATAIR
jgi:hypothetical protein